MRAHARSARAAALVACVLALPGAARAVPVLVPVPPLDAPAKSRALAAIHAASGRVLARHGSGLVVDAPPGAALPRGSRRLRADEKLRREARGSRRPAAVVHPSSGTSPGDLAVRLAATSREVEVGERFVVLRPAPGELELLNIAGRDDVLAVVTVDLEARGLLDEARGLIQSGGGVESIHALGVAGQDEIVAVADSGLSVGHCAFEDGDPIAYELVDPASRPIAARTSPQHRKVQAYQYLVVTDQDDEQDTARLFWHGTAVCGIVAADEGEPPGEPVLHPDAFPAASGASGFDGHAPGARLVVQDLHVSGPSYSIPSDLANFIESSYLAGARTWNASWETVGGGVWDHFARELDVVSLRRPELVLVAAAGNSGSAAGTVVAPATARNAIAVGNSATGTFVEDVAPTSSHGPAADGRRKPDLVAPGSGIDTADGGEACGVRRGTGTSFAAPAVAAASALVRQWYREGRESGGFPLSAPARTPSSALVRATLAASTRSLRGGPQGTVVEQPAPSPEQGFGRVVLDQALSRSPSRRMVVLSDDDVTTTSDGFATGSTVPVERTLRVTDPSASLTIALAFNDALAGPLATSPILNDLDLVVRSPDGSTYLGNAFEAGWSVPGGAADPLNNLEIVKLEPPVAAGDWTIAVVPTEILVGPQAHALLAIGGICAPLSPFGSGGGGAETSCGSLSVSAPSVGGSEPVRYSVFRAATPGGQDFGAPTASGLRRAAFPDSGLAPGTWYYVFEAFDACGATTRSPEIAVNVGCARDPLLRVTKDGDAVVVLTWDDGSDRAVRRHAVAGAVAGSLPIGTGVGGRFEEPIPPGPLAFYLVR